MFRAEIKLTNILSYQVDGVTFHKNKKQMITGENGRALAEKLKSTRGFVVRVLEDTPDEVSAVALEATKKRTKSLSLEE